jgi:hypothetical protein
MKSEQALHTYSLPQEKLVTTGGELLKSSCGKAQEYLFSFQSIHQDGEEIKYCRGKARLFEVPER